MQVTRADPDQPDLSLGNASVQLVTSRQFIHSNFVPPALDVDGCKFAFVFVLEMGANIAFVNGVAATGKFFFAVAAFGRTHDHPPGERNSVRLMTAPHAPTPPPSWVGTARRRTRAGPGQPRPRHAPARARRGGGSKPLPILLVRPRRVVRRRRAHRQIGSADSWRYPEKRLCCQGTGNPTASKQPNTLPQRPGRR